MAAYDAIVVGSGPNGLAAAITLARAGRSVLVREAASTAGGAARSAELTLDGFIHDVGSAVHPLGAASSFFRSLPLADHGLRWITPPAALAHPFDSGPAALLHRSVANTALTLGTDGPRYRSIVAPLVKRYEALFDDILAPLHLPRHPLLLARFGVTALRRPTHLFRDDRATAWFGGICAHAGAPLTAPPSAAFGLVLAVAGHAVSWPIPAGGAQSITNALVAHLRSLGGEIVTDAPVTSLAELSPTPLVLLDMTPRQFIRLAEDRLPPSYTRTLATYQYAPGAYKIDWALSGPIPWRDPACASAGTLHLVGSMSELLQSENAPWRGQSPDRPYVLLAQPSLFDPTRAPPGRHTAWAYCHVPNGSTDDMTDRIERQVERFAPGFRDCILARHVAPPASLERMDANLVGGDVGGGAVTMRQLFFRPTMQWNPYATPLRGVYLCSASTPPGGGVHGLPGYWAARSALLSSGP
jgi:phytoene dehydrogenase-like protein